MRRLYLQVYVAFVAILALFAALTATLWHLRGPSPQDQQLLEGAAAVVAERLPSGSRAEQEASLRGLAAPLRLNLSLWSADGQPVKRSKPRVGQARPLSSLVS